MLIKRTNRLPGLFYAGLLSILALAAAMPSVPPAIVSGQSSQAPEAIEKLVNVGGYDLYFRIIPGNGPSPHTSLVSAFLGPQAL